MSGAYASAKKGNVSIHESLAACDREQAKALRLYAERLERACAPFDHEVVLDVADELRRIASGLDAIAQKHDEAAR